MGRVTRIEGIALPWASPHWEVTILPITIGSQLQGGRLGVTRGRGWVSVTCWQFVKLLGEDSYSVRDTGETAKSEDPPWQPGDPRSPWSLLPWPMRTSFHLTGCPFLL